MHYKCLFVTIHRNEAQTKWILERKNMEFIYYKMYIVVVYGEIVVKWVKEKRTYIKFYELVRKSCGF